LITASYPSFVLRQVKACHDDTARYRLEAFDWHVFGSLQPARVVQLAEKQVRELYWNLLMVWRLPVRDNNRSIHALSTLYLKKLSAICQSAP
jgi:hypothetical protein